MDKKGVHIGLDELIFITISVVFFVLFLFFVIRASAGTFILEEFYAKQIALLVDGSKPETIIGLDITDYYNMAEEDKLDLENRFIISDNKVIVSLTNSQGYVYPYFSNVYAKSVTYNIVDADGEKRVFVNFELVENE